MTFAINVNRSPNGNKLIFPKLDKLTIPTARQTVVATVLRRKKNARDTLKQSIVAGYYLTHIKSSLGHGNWLSWLRDNALDLGYGGLSTDPVRAAQYDMALYRKLLPHLDTMLSLGIITEEASDAIDNLDDTASVFVMSAFYEFTRKDTPDLAIELALETIAALQAETPDDDEDDNTPQGDSMDSRKSSGSIKFDKPHSKRLIKYAKAAEALSDDDRETAKALYRHGMDNPDILEQLPLLKKEYPEIVEEMVNTGTLSVPQNDEQMDVSLISVTDINLAMGDAATELEIQKLANRTEVADTLRSEAFYDFQGTFTGTPEQILHELRIAMGQCQQENGAIEVRVSWHKRRDTE